MIHNPGRTQVAALNLGLREATGEVIVQMDAHTFYPPDYVATGVRRLRARRRRLGDRAAGPSRRRRRVAPRRRSRSVRGLGRAAPTSGGRRRRPEIELDTGVFGGVWWRATLERLGGWDERFVVNHDAELAARHLEAGGRIVARPMLVCRLRARAGRCAASGASTAATATTARAPAACTRRACGRRIVVVDVPAVTALAALLPGPLGRLARAGLAGYAVLAITVARPRLPPAAGPPT